MTFRERPQLPSNLGSTPYELVVNAMEKSEKAYTDEIEHRRRLGLGAKKRFAERFCGLTPKEYSELEDRHEKVLEIFSEHEFERILDVGCGDGNFSMLIGKACKAEEVYGIEISEKGVEMARNNGVKCFQLDLDEQDLPFKDDFFDAVFAGEVIEHLFDPDHFLDEIHRVLKADSVFVLSTPNLASIHNRVALLLGYQPFPMGASARINVGRIYEPNSEHAQSLDHIRVFTLRTLKDLLRIRGFRILKVKGSYAQTSKQRIKKLVETMDRFSAKFPSISYRVIVVCRKPNLG